MHLCISSNVLESTWRLFYFLRAEVDGFCTLMIYYQRNQKTDALEDTYVFRKGEEKCYLVVAKIISKMYNNGESLEDYLSTCDAVKKFMTTKGQSKNYQEFAKIYNSECGG